MNMATCHRILYIEDDIALGRLLQKRLNEKKYDVSVVTNATDGIKAVEQMSFDLVLLDNFLPDLEGIEVLAALHPLEDRPPILLLTASGDERLAIEALEKGAADYVIKDPALAYIELLPAVMQAAYTRFRLARENRTQREELRIAWEKAEVASRAKSAFLSAISHEIRTPLNVIIGATALLEKTDLDGNQQSLSTTLKSHAELLLALVNDTLDLSKIEAGAMMLETLPFSTADLIAELQQMFGTTIGHKNLEFVVRDNATAVQWQGDPLRVKQILVNLLSNAIKFTEKGVITLESQVTDEGSLQFNVSDTGIGISKDKQIMIFESFSQADQSTTRHYGGTGLGLALCRSLIFLMHGSITLQSTKGVGTTFTVTLPLKSSGKAVPPVTSQNVAVQAGRRPDGNPVQFSGQPNILLVEDYPANAMIAQMMLSGMGFQVTWVNSGIEAVKVVREATAPYKAILMDIQMQGMDGYKATHEIRLVESARNWHQPIIGVTAHALHDEAERCRKAGMDDYLSKPVNWGFLEEKLQNL